MYLDSLHNDIQSHMSYLTTVGRIQNGTKVKIWDCSGVATDEKVAEDIARKIQAEAEYDAMAREMKGDDEVRDNIKSFFSAAASEKVFIQKSHENPNNFSIDFYNMTEDQAKRLALAVKEIF